MSIIVLASAKGSPGVDHDRAGADPTWPLRDPTVRTAPGSACERRGRRGPGVPGGRRPGRVRGRRRVPARRRPGRRGPGRVRAIRERPRRHGDAGAGGVGGVGTPRASCSASTDPVQARSVAPVLRSAIEALDGDDTDVLVDLGRLAGADRRRHRHRGRRGRGPGARGVPVDAWRRCPRRVTWSTRLRSRTDQHRPGHGLRVGAVVVGPGRPYPSRDVARAVGARRGRRDRLGPGRRRRCSRTARRRGGGSPSPRCCARPRAAATAPAPGGASRPCRIDRWRWPVVDIPSMPRRAAGRRPPGQSPCRERRRVPDQGAASPSMPVVDEPATAPVDHALVREVRTAVAAGWRPSCSAARRCRRRHDRELGRHLLTDRAGRPGAGPGRGGGAGLGGRRRSSRSRTR